MISIAIDGPAGAGKSTIAKLLARKIGATYIDTGAMYRALTFKALKHNIDLEDEATLVTLLQKTKIELVPNQNVQLVFLDGVDVSAEIRSPEVNQHVSIVAKHAKVRELMVELQQTLAKKSSVVMDGRDIGTIVLPKADVKIFLTASVEERAARRHKELLHKGYEASLTTILQEIKDRDRLDSERETSPLVQADDATLIDATSLSIEEVVDTIFNLTTRHLES